MAIVLKGKAIGETDRLVTLFSPEQGLISAIAPGARKPKSSLRGRVEMFVINQFLLAQGKSLDRIVQAETQASFPELSRDVCLLSAGQYLIELILRLAVPNTPQVGLYELFIEHLRRLATQADPNNLYAHLAQGVFHCLAIEGFAPQFYHCAITGNSLTPNFFDPQWRVGFSLELGGIVQLPLLESFQVSQTQKQVLTQRLTAIELCLLQQLEQPELPDFESLPPLAQKRFRVWDWVTVEHLLRRYAQYQFNRPFQAASMVDDLWELEF